MSEIEKYYNGEIHVDFDEEIEELKADIEEYRDSTTWWSNRFNAVERDNRELRKEIERLKNKVEELMELYTTEREVKEDYKSIIKEVREYIENNTYKIEWGDLEQDNEDININEDLTEKEFIEGFIEILDKENNNENI